MLRFCSPALPRFSTTVSSPVGKLTLAGDGDLLTHVLFANSKDETPRTAKSDRKALPEVREQLAEYFGGDRTAFDLKVAPKGTAFQLSVWKGLAKIAFGKTRSYGELAAIIGNPKASRAVGLANGRNPISIIVPCHRVIGSTGTLTGFGGGLDVKQDLLRLEGWSVENGRVR